MTAREAQLATALRANAALRVQAEGLIASYGDHCIAIIASGAKRTRSVNFARIIGTRADGSRCLLKFHGGVSNARTEPRSYRRCAGRPFGRLLAGQWPGERQGGVGPQHISDATRPFVRSPGGI